jgi:hypothetical protein
MVEGVAGLLLMVVLLNALCPQLLLALTDSVPEVNELLTVREMLLVPCPLAIVVFNGAVQV